MDETDAQDFVTLRNNPRYHRFLANRTQILTVESQLKWMRTLHDNADFKIVLHPDRFAGSIALYDIRDGQAEFGRYIVTNPISAVESEYLILKYGFEQLKLNRIFCNTVKKNDLVWRQHTRFGFTIYGEDYDPRVAEVRVQQEIYRDQYLKFDYRPILSLIEKIRF